MFRLSLISCLGLCLSLIDQANAQDCKASLDFQTLSTNQNYLTTSGRIVDVDLDGTLDVVYTNSTQAIIYYGNQNATFSAPVTVALPGPAGQIDFGHLNQDQFVDLVITVPSQGKVIIKLGSAVRTFNGATTTLLSSAIAFDQERDLTVVDLNGDGTSEILTSAHKTGANCGVYIRQSSNGFSSLSQSQCLISELGRVVARDIDQDGALELIQSKTAKIYDIDINAVPFAISGTPQQIDLQGAITEIDQVHVFDLGADDDLDLIITGKNAGQIPTMVSIDNPIKFACNDTIDNDADGLIDYPSDLGCDALDDSSELHAQPCQVLPLSALPLDVADFNHDGLVDLVNYTTVGVGSTQSIMLQAFCGNRLVSSTEACDDGNLVNTDGCTNACQLPRCGDAIIQAGEACDDGNAINTDLCLTNCKLPTCGDGVIQAGETCDDGNNADGDGCNATCQSNTQVKFIEIASGTYRRGAMYTADSTTSPVVNVNIRPFVISRTEITVAQYRQCFNAGACSAPDVTTGCNWSATPGTKENHPINCVSWAQAKAYTNYLDSLPQYADLEVRLPTEAEWEYAARSQGQLNTYPWGAEAFSCNHAKTTDCLPKATVPVCSFSKTLENASVLQPKTKNGDTIQGLCDMAGNVEEWTEDWYETSYTLVPTDGSARIGSPVNSLRVTRGGSWNAVSGFTNTSRRSYNSLSYKRAFLGFRVASYNRCGNGVVDTNEQCDDANKDANDGCDALCRFECGNGQLEPSELATARPCDDGNRTNGDGCNSTCQVELNYACNNSNPPSVCVGDADNDGVSDANDNCVNDANEDQANDDADALGDACDACLGDATNDSDSDTICHSVDNCPNVPNQDQTDTDSDLIGDACDPCLGTGHDNDTDGICSEANPADNCPDVANANQADLDTDGFGNLCDDDRDGDGVLNDADLNADSAVVCGDSDADTCDDCTSGALDTTADGPNYDGDAICDATDPDLDNDGVVNANDTCTSGDLNWISDADTDVDGDGCQDSNEDLDDDNDTVLDQNDNCQFVSNVGQLNTLNEDALGDACDDDHDNDGVLNDSDNCPFISNVGQENFDATNDGGDACDDDDDNDLVTDLNDSDDANPNVCKDQDNDTCDDCVSGTFAPNNDGADDDNDGKCNVGDFDFDNDGWNVDDEITCQTSDADPTQEPVDTDLDGLCNDYQDTDNDDDGFSNADEITCLSANPSAKNDNQVMPTDTDNDDACDDGVDTDDDNDGVLDTQEDIDGTNPLLADTDGDTINDLVDNCDLVSNQNQLNYDNDAFGDVCDSDIDNDGSDNAEDLDDFNIYLCGDEDADGCNDCSKLGYKDVNDDGLDTDGDDICDSTDTDDDGDGALDTVETDCGSDPLDLSSTPLNTDGTDLCDGLDTDDDNDTFSDLDETTNCQENTDPKNASSVPSDLDDDGLCNAMDSDADGDSVLNIGPNADSNDLNAMVCRDQDNDTCDDCALAGLPDTLNDGDDYDTDGRCDSGDLDDDGDGYKDADEITCGSDPLDVTALPNDFDLDFKCDTIDPDDDNDTVADGSDSYQFDRTLCRDLDADGCDDCAVAFKPNTSNDGLDSDTDGQCNFSDTDDDNDGFSDVDEGTCLSNPLVDEANLPVDHDADGLCDHGVDTDDDDDGFSDADELVCFANDASATTDDTRMPTDTDADGECDAGVDTDDDNDGVVDTSDSASLNPHQCADQDTDGCDDCSQILATDFSGNMQADITNDGLDTNLDGQCDLTDTDDDGDGFSDADEITCGTLPLDNTSVPTDTDNQGDCDNGVDSDDDNDGFSDADETTCGTDPLLDTSVPTDFDNDDLCDNGVDSDDDNDTVADAQDSNDNDIRICHDLDNDQCDDCAIANPPSLSNDGTDTDNDGRCNTGDTDDDNDGYPDADEVTCGSNALLITSRPTDTDNDLLCNGVDADDDNDTVLDDVDTNSIVATICADSDGDTCDDCAVASKPRPLNDGADFDGDGLCNNGDTDDDNDGATDPADSNDANRNVCSDNDSDSCDDCSTGTYSLSLDGADTDNDGLCNDGDPDDDNDGALDAADTDDANQYVCSDNDNDNCNDCSSGTYAPGNDGTDTNNDGQCDSGEPDDDGDGVNDDNDSAPSNPNVCSDNDNDSCDDCSTGTFTLSGDGSDFDGDGRCDDGDDDDDNDGVVDADDSNDANPNVCRDDDNDTCDDCALINDLLVTQGSSNFNVANDGDDFDSDGQCDAGDSDDDNDGVTVADGDSDDHDFRVCKDDDSDGCDDCALITDFDDATGVADPNNDGADNDSDGACDSFDTDDDNDSVLDVDDSNDFSPTQCQDLDGDTCDDCALSANNFSSIDTNPDPTNDGIDTDSDGDCDEGDNDIDNDGILNGPDTSYFDPTECADADGDGCDDCSQTPNDANKFDVGDNFSTANDGQDTDGDGACDTAELFTGNDDDDDDNDGVADLNDADPLDPLRCRDLDGDSCDDCSQTPNDASKFDVGDNFSTTNDGQDTDSDGICDTGTLLTGTADTDDDNDGVLDGSDNFPLDPSQCQDEDEDTCDDCSQTANSDFAIGSNVDVDDDGQDSDLDGICDATDTDKDDDGVTVAQGDLDDLDSNVCKDLDNDGCDDCGYLGLAQYEQINGVTFATQDGASAGTDTDEDGLCDDSDFDFNPTLTRYSTNGSSADTDDDNDGVLDTDELAGVGGGAPTDTLNPSACGDSDNDGCDDCVLTAADDFSPGANFTKNLSNLVIDDGNDLDSDGLCDTGDTDKDNDGVSATDEAANATPTSDTDPSECGDADADGCDDCSATANNNFAPGSNVDLSNDGLDTDADTFCNVGDTDDDNDGVLDTTESGNGFDPLSPFSCADDDNDSCDDCSQTPNNASKFDAGPNNVMANDGLDTDGDGFCNQGPLAGGTADPDDDNDGVNDVDEPNLAAKLDPSKCGDSDSDTCDDCSATANNNFAVGTNVNVAADGPDNDLDGLCNAGDTDDDNDGVNDADDPNDNNQQICGDSDSDTCDDCSLSVTPINNGDVNKDASNDGTDTDTDGKCDLGDLDDDNDGVLDINDPNDTNPRICGNSDGDTCDDCTNGAATFIDTDTNKDINNDGNDFDSDSKCDASDTDIDNDGVLNAADSDDFNIAVCRDLDGDTCDDCALITDTTTQQASVSNDGTDTDSDGQCNAGDSDDDNDGISDIHDTASTNPLQCRDSDNDTCDDCAMNTTGFNADNNATPNNDGLDTDSDGRCNDGDTDDDNDGVLDATESTNSTDPLDPSKCGDSDTDTCDDCSATASNNFTAGSNVAVNNDGTDTDTDGQCNAGDTDDDNDGVLDATEELNLTDPLDPSKCGDSDADTCDDCSATANNNFAVGSNVATANDGADNDLDGSCDAGDTDDDNDTVPDTTDPADFNPIVCGDSDTDTCDDCVLSTNDFSSSDTNAAPNADGTDTDSDGQCNAGDTDDDNDGVLDVNEPSVGASIDPFVCGDSDTDTCDDCSQTPNDGTEFDLGSNVAVANDGPDNDTDGKCDDFDDDDDNDGFTDASETLCSSNPMSASSIIVDTDGDDVCDAIDSCQGDDYSLNNDAHLEAANAKVCNDLDLDDDNDGFSDIDETTCINAAAALDDEILPLDTDADGQCDAGIDMDDDNDGVTDTDEQSRSTNPLDPSECGDSDIDTCDDCSATANNNFAAGTNVATSNDGMDTDSDGLCNNGDDDDDNDGVLDATEITRSTNPLDPSQCGDTDTDTCDDCSATANNNFAVGTNVATNNDGLDTDSDGMCNNGDANDDNDAFSDADETTCGSDPLLSSSLPTDTDSDGQCDDGVDADDDNDGILDGPDTDDLNPSVCADADNDGCDDCSANAANNFAPGANFSVANDGLDTDADGLCNAGDSDDDNDTFSDATETTCNTNPLLNSSVPADQDNDGICNFADICEGDNATLDIDNDKKCGNLDLDDDGDGWRDIFETPAVCNTNPNDASSVPADTDGDGTCDLRDPCAGASNNDNDNDRVCDENDTDDDDDTFSDTDEIACGSDPLDASSLAPDNDADASCNAIDADDDNDGVDDINEAFDFDASKCGDRDNDDCDDCSSTLANNFTAGPNFALSGAFVTNDGLDTDADGLCNAGDTDDDGDQFADTMETACGSNALNASSVPADTDGDFVCNSLDQCQGDDASGNTDSDAQCNDTDTDDDGDNYSDLAETACGSNPTDASSKPADPDQDGLCNVATDPTYEDQDDDNDGVNDTPDIAPLDPTRCKDTDNDNCDDCALIAPFGSPATAVTSASTSNDGQDDDNDGLCNLGDNDADNDSFSDSDETTCGSNPNNVSSLPLDTDGDLACDNGIDTDDDNDGVLDANEPNLAAKLDPSRCGDSDGDTCDDCSATANNNFAVGTNVATSNDGLDTDADGLCNLGDLNDDGDAFSDADEITCGSDPLLSSSLPTDTDSDGQCDNGVDTDDDNDGVLDGPDTDDLNPSVCADVDTDSCDDCSANASNNFAVGANFNVANDGLDTDNDGRCNVGDVNDDNDAFTDAVETQCGSDPLLSSSVPVNTDGDAFCNAIDKCPNVSSATNTDTDNDGTGDDCDCGDGLVRGTEQCDASGETANCNADCTTARCGDQKTNVTRGEQCDDGNLSNADGCTNSCRFPGCGDGLVQAGEACDDGNTNDQDNCRNTCVVATCGDGIIKTSGTGTLEQCDDAGETANCDTDCTLARCGDGRINTTRGETCDVSVSTTSCDNDCTAAFCGDGFVNSARGELCDDGNTNDFDSCKNNCRPPVCGNGVIEPGEECDNGTSNNNTRANACRTNCKLPSCGDGVIDNLSGETCDDRNLINTDACLNTCLRASCGDGFVGPGEACDEGPSNADTPNATCRSNCIVSKCGDMIVDNTSDRAEECDDGNTISTDSCISCKAPRCGDGVKAPNEECDDGNDMYGDTCLPPSDVNACDLNNEASWISIPGGSFMIGDGLSNRTPKKLITLSAFEISRSEVTIAQYRKCVIAGVCSIPLNTTASANAGCNWTATAGAKEQHPVNCVSWVQARQYISWIDSADPNFTYALPSEAEWEYVARNISEGVDYLQPWGSATPSCNYLVFRSGSTSATNGCGTNSTATVCLKSTTEDTTGNVVRTAFNGDTLHGVCDMAGNVQEWTADFYVANYNSTPTNGSPYVGPATLTGRVVRGSSWSSASSAVLNYIRSSLVNTSRSNAIGFRVVRR